MPRSILLLALLGLSPVASAAPTAAEAALRAHLAGQDAAAERTLVATDDPRLVALAARLALANGDLAGALRLSSGDSPAARWGRIEVAARSGDLPGAARLALAEMDDALGDAHRDALGRLLVSWADERAPTDPSHAALFLRAALGLAPPAAVRRLAEDRLFRLPGDDADPYRLARARLVTEPTDLGARLRVAPKLASARFDTALLWLADVARQAPEPDAVAAARALTELPRRAPNEVLSALAGLAARFPTNTEVARLRLAYATSFAALDEEAGTAALAALEADPTVGGEAAVARAEATSDPQRRRALYLALSAREGASERGEVARKGALDALLAGVEAATDPAAKVAAARAALATPDGAGRSDLLVDAVAEGPARVAELFALARRFPDGPACDPLGDAIMAESASGAPLPGGDTAGTDVAHAYAEVCSTGSSAGGSLLLSEAHGSASILLRPQGSTLRVYAAGAASLQVQEHEVDPEALFRATTGDPRDATLDASLLAPDRAWDVPLGDEGTARPGDGRPADVTLSPRGRAPMTALTVRGGDQRETALVVADPLDVQTVRQGDRVVVAVLRAGAPVAGAALLVQDGDGAFHEARTGRDGLARLEAVTGPVRLYARAGLGVGFAVGSMDAGAAEERPEVWQVVPFDRAIPSGGAYGDVEIFGTRAGGAGSGAVRVRSLDAAGELLEEGTVTVVAGAARARLYLQGGGRVEVTRPADRTHEEEWLAAVGLGRAEEGEGVRGLHITWEPAVPRAGEAVTAVVRRLDTSADGSGLRRAAGSVHVRTPWSDETKEVVLGDEPLRVPIGAAPGLPGERLSVDLSLLGGPTVSSMIRLGDEPRTGAEEGGPAEDENGSDRPAAGAANGHVDAHGIWTGPPTLAVLTVDGLERARIVRSGERVASLAGGGAAAPGASSADGAATPGLAGWRTAYVTMATGELVPVTGAAAPSLVVAPVSADAGHVAVDVTLPPGSRVWAWLRDATDSPPVPAGRVVAPLGEAAPGVSGDPWLPSDRWGSTIAAALLDEEERLAEGKDLREVDFGFGAGEEAAEGGVLGGMGMGLGGGGSSGYGRGGGTWSATDEAYGDTFGLGWDPHGLGSVEAAAPGRLTFAVPGWVAMADLEVVAVTPDGRWVSDVSRVSVGPGALPIPLPPAPALPATWDGAPATLRLAAAALPDSDARLLAFTGLAPLDPASRLASQAAFAQAPSGPGVALASALAGRPLPTLAADAEDLPDARLYARAEAALLLVSSDPDRSRAMARRILATTEAGPLPEDIRVRAALALWLGGLSDEAIEALPGDTPLIRAARRVVQAPTADATPEDHAAWWSVARAEAADPLDRALCLVALAGPGGARQGVDTARRPGRAPPSDAPASAPVPAPARLSLQVEPPLAELRGEVYPRGGFDGTDAPLSPVDHVPSGRTVPVDLLVPASAVPTRVSCPAGASERATWLTLPPSATPRWASCEVVAAGRGAQRWAMAWYGPDGRALGEGEGTVTVEAPRDSVVGDPMSPRERFTFGLRAALTGAGTDMLEQVVATEALPADETRAATLALLTAKRGGADPRALIAAFEAVREHAPDGGLDLAAAAAVAHAYAAVGEPDRALAAARVVLDARFKEELGAVSQIQEAGLSLTALKLLRDLVDRYPDGPTVQRARFLMPSMLLARAEGDGDRLGYTRSSLRHTAAGELAAYLLGHGEASDAPAAATLLLDALHELGDVDREGVLAAPLARRYHDDPVAWRLTLADAQARAGAGHEADALRVLEGIEAPEEGRSEVDLELGRVLEALGRHADAQEAFARSGEAEALDRRSWLERTDLALPPRLELRPGDPRVLRATLRPGRAGTLTAVRVSLEAAMLEAGGDVSPDALHVDGLHPTAARPFRVDGSGDVPLPPLTDGAWLVTVGVDGVTARALVVVSDAELDVRTGDGGGTLVRLFDGRGAPLAGASVWLFADGAVAGTARTDGAGAAWVPYGGGALGVLARSGERYAVWTGSGGAGPSAPAAPAQGQLMEQNNADYEEMFRQESKQSVRADML